MPARSNKRRKKKKAEKKEKKDAAPAADAGAAYTEKEMKAAIKEGGKKAQDIAGMHDLGGMSYFSICLESCKGDWDLIVAAMNAANKVVDEDADDRKGGAGDVAKCFLSCDDAKHVALYYHVPKALQANVSIDDWISNMTSSIDGKVLEKTDEFAKVIAYQNSEKELFPLKMRDEAINASFRWLKEKKLVPDDDSDDSDYDTSQMYEDAGVEW